MKAAISSNKLCASLMLTSRVIASAGNITRMGTKKKAE